MLLAQELEQAGSDAEAEAVVTKLLAEPLAPSALTVLSQRVLVRLSAKRGEWPRAAEAWEVLARDSGSPTFAGACVRRAAELWDARVGAADRAEPLFARLHEADPGDGGVAAALVRLYVSRGETDRVASVLQRVGASHDEGTDSGLLLARGAHRKERGDMA